MSRFSIALLAVILAGSTATTAFADSRSESDNAWAASDKCAREAARMFPDYTPQGNAARENYRRACLRAYGEPAPNGQASTSGN